MTQQLMNTISAFELRRISEYELIQTLPFSVKNKSIELRKIMNEIIQKKKGEEVVHGLSLLLLLEEQHEFTDLLHQLILAPWHNGYEVIIQALGKRKNERSIPVIKLAMQQKFTYLESYNKGTKRFIRLCVEALTRIGTRRAEAALKELVCSTDPILKSEMELALINIERNNGRHYN